MEVALPRTEPGNKREESERNRKCNHAIEHEPLTGEELAEEYEGHGAEAARVAEGDEDTGDDGDEAEDGVAAVLGLRGLRSIPSQHCVGLHDGEVGGGVGGELVRPPVEQHEAGPQVSQHHEEQTGHQQRPPTQPRDQHRGQGVTHHILNTGGSQQCSVVTMDSDLRGHQNGADVLVQGDVCHLEDGDGVVAHLHTWICIYCIMVVWRWMSSPCWTR